MSQRIKQAFLHKAKIAYLTAGDGGDIPEQSHRLKIQVQRFEFGDAGYCSPLGAKFESWDLNMNEYKSAEYFIALANAGVNILEVGVPFSDPIADGPSIQLAMERAIQNGTNLKKVLQYAFFLS